MDAFRNELAGLETRIARLADERAEVELEAKDLRDKIAELTERKTAKPNYYARVFGFLVCAAVGFVGHGQLLKRPTPNPNPATIDPSPIVESFERDRKLYEFKIELPYKWSRAYLPNSSEVLIRDPKKTLTEIALAAKVDVELFDTLSNGTLAFAVGERGTILRRTSEGGPWVKEEIVIPDAKGPVLEGVRAIGRASFGRWIAVGDRGLVLERESTDPEKPSTWHPPSSTLLIASSLRALIVGRDGKPFVVGDRGTLLREFHTGKAGGSGWSQIPVPTNEDLFSGIALDDGTLVLATRTGTILTYRPQQEVFSVDYTSVNEPVRGFGMFKEEIALTTMSQSLYLSGLHR